MGKSKPSKKRVEDLIEQVSRCAKERIAKRQGRAISVKQSQAHKRLADASAQVGAAWQRHKIDHYNGDPPKGSYKKFVRNYWASHRQ